MFHKPAAKTVNASTPGHGYQPSYLREPTHQHSSYQSHSPAKHSLRFNQNLQSTSKTKNQQNSLSSAKKQMDFYKRPTDQQSKSNLHQQRGTAEPSGTAMKNSTSNQQKSRSGSQFISAKKYGGHLTSTSTSRGPANNTLQRHKE